MAASKYTIAIMDEESKERNHFINFFEDTFNVVEIPFVATVDDLIDKIKTEQIDALAIDYKLKDHKSKFTKNGDFYFKEIMNRLQDFPSFVLTQDPDKAKRESKLIKPRFIIGKTILHSANEDETKTFKSEMKQEIKAYKDLLATKIKKLKLLEKKRNTKRGLDEESENDFLKLNNEIAQSLTGYESFPLKYFSQETSKKLDEVISKTDDLIREISAVKKKK